MLIVAKFMLPVSHKLALVSIIVVHDLLPFPCFLSTS